MPANCICDWFREHNFKMLSTLITNLWFLMTVSVTLTPFILSPFGFFSRHSRASLFVSSSRVFFYVTLAPFFMSPSGLTRGSTPPVIPNARPLLVMPDLSFFFCHSRSLSFFRSSSCPSEARNRHEDPENDAALLLRRYPRVNPGFLSASRHLR